MSDTSEDPLPGDAAVTSLPAQDGKLGEHIGVYLMGEKESWRSLQMCKKLLYEKNDNDQSDHI